MHKANRFMFLVLCSVATVLVVFLSRQGLVVIPTKPFRTLAVHHRDVPNSTTIAYRGNDIVGQLYSNATVQTQSAEQTQFASQPLQKHRRRPSACVPPQIHPFDPSLSDVLESYPPLDCSGGLPSVVTVSHLGGAVRLVVDRMLVKQKLRSGEQPACRYRAISVRPGGDFNTTATEWSEFFSDSTQAGPSEEHFVVECYETKNLKSPLVAKSYLSVVRERESLEKSLREKLSDHVRKNAPKETLNVVVLGIDGMSKQNMIRTLPKTRDFLLGTLRAKEMLNYNKNGMNTFPNVITLLTGKTVSEISSEYSWNTGRFFDDIPFVWDEFARAGYRTQMSLDSSRVTSFHCSKQGFSRPPVHYYHRPLVLQSEPDADVRHKDGNCIGDTPEVTFLLDYVLQMANVFGRRSVSKSDGNDNGQAENKRSLKKRAVADSMVIRTGEKNHNDESDVAKETNYNIEKVGHALTSDHRGQSEKPENQLLQQLQQSKQQQHQYLHYHQQQQLQLQQQKQINQQQQQQQQQQQHQQYLEQQLHLEHHQHEEQHYQEEQHQPLQQGQSETLSDPRPFFSYNFFVRLTHDNPQKASSGDLIYRDFFSSLHSTGALNNTVLIFFSDHGPRFGPL
ncbi:hypothetical protein PoB_006968600, partial [Plakobranchus ocellatus]